MKFPVYIPAFEPRVRRRWWSGIRRAKAIAKEASTENNIEKFYMSLSPSHQNNPFAPHDLLYLIGQIGGVITFMATTSSAD